MAFTEASANPRQRAQGTLIWGLCQGGVKGPSWMNQAKMGNQVPRWAPKWLRRPAAARASWARATNSNLVPSPAPSRPHGCLNVNLSPRKSSWRTRTVLAGHK